MLQVNLFRLSWLNHALSVITPGPMACIFVKCTLKFIKYLYKVVRVSLIISLLKCMIPDVATGYQGMICMGCVSK